LCNNEVGTCTKSTRGAGSRREAGEIGRSRRRRALHQIVAFDLRRYQGFADPVRAGIGFEPCLIDNDSERECRPPTARPRLLEPIPGDIAVGDDGGRARGARLATRAPSDGSTSRRYDVVARLPSATSTVIGSDVSTAQSIRGAQRARRFFGAEAVPPAHSHVCRASMHSSTIFSCGTSPTRSSDRRAGNRFTSSFRRPRFAAGSAVGSSGDRRGASTRRMMISASP